MQRFAAIFMLLLAAAAPVRASNLRGVILLNELRGPPVAGVRVSAAGADAQVTDDKGQFLLEFPQRAFGDTVQVVVEHPDKDYVVVNDIQLDVRLPSDEEALTATLVVCKQKERWAYGPRFYRRKSTEAVEVSFHIRSDGIKADPAALSKLRKDRDLARLVVSVGAHDLAEVDTKSALGTYKTAMRLFLLGQVEEALAQSTVRASSIIE